MIETMSASKPPLIQNFLDVRSFLQAVYDFRKLHESKFSYATWASEMGFKSRSFLRFVILGKRSITDQTLPAFIRSLKLNSKDAHYFEKLVRFTQASTVQEREFYSSDLIKSKKRSLSEQINPVKDQFLFLQTPLAPQIQVLIATQGIEWTTEQISKTLQKKSSEVLTALQLLERLQMAKFLPETETWTSIIQHFSVPGQAGSHAIQSFHRKSLETSIQAIDADPAIRNYQSLFLNLSSEKYQLLQSRMEEVIEEFRAEFSQADCLPISTLYQINLNLIPLSKPILRHPPSNDVSVGEIKIDLEITE